MHKYKEIKQHSDVSSGNRRPASGLPSQRSTVALIARAHRSDTQRGNLSVGSAGDRYEQEAERAARLTVDGNRSTGIAGNRGISGNGRYLAGSVAEGPAGKADLRGALQGGQPLEMHVRRVFEPGFGQCLGDIRIHKDAEAARMASSINARAFALGNHVVMGSGEYNPYSRSGRLLLGHEIAHTLQPSGETVRREPAATACPEYDNADWQLSREAPALLTRLGEPTANDAGMEQQDWILANFAISEGTLGSSKIENPMRFLIDLLTRAEEYRAWTSQGYFQRRFLLTGYADCIGSEEQNSALAQKRVEAVRDLLVSQLDDAGIQGNNTERVKIKAAVGEGHPFPQDTAEMRAMSRSVLIEEEWIPVPGDTAKEIEKEKHEEAEKRREDFMARMPESWLEHAKASPNAEYQYWAETVSANWKAYIESMQKDARIMMTTSHEIHVGTLDSIGALCDRSPDYCPIASSDGYMPQSIYYYMSHSTGEQLRTAQFRESQAMIMVNTTGGTDDITWNTLPYWMRTGIR